MAVEYVGTGVARIAVNGGRRGRRLQCKVGKASKTNKKPAANVLVDILKATLFTNENALPDTET